MLLKKKNNSEDSDFSDDSSQNYDSDISSENISRQIAFVSEEDKCSDDEEIGSNIQQAHRQKQGKSSLLFLYWEDGLRIEIHNSENPSTLFELLIIPEKAELMGRKTIKYVQQCPE